MAVNPHPLQQIYTFTPKSQWVLKNPFFIFKMGFLIRTDTSTPGVAGKLNWIDDPAHTRYEIPIDNRFGRNDLEYFDIWALIIFGFRFNMPMNSGESISMSRIQIIHLSWIWHQIVLVFFQAHGRVVHLVIIGQTG